MTQQAVTTGSEEHTFTWEPVTVRASGETLSLAIHTLEGAEAGPTLGLFSTSHGDEAYGIEVIRALLERIDPKELRGTIRALPVGNPVAFESFTRTTGQGMNTDMNNLNRVFPGSPDGWLTQQIAHVISSSFVVGLDYLVDFHCGGLETAIDYVLIQNEHTSVDETSYRLSLLCGTDFLYQTDQPAHQGTLTQYAKSQGIPTVIAEFGGCVPADSRYLERYLRGLQNVMIDLGMLDGEIELPPRQRILSGTRSLLRPRTGGLFIPEVGFDCLGKTVAGGTVLARIVSPHTFEELDVLKAPYDETVIFMMRGVLSRVNPGDYAYILGNGASAEVVRNDLPG